jgi:hypothetical protein
MIINVGLGPTVNELDVTLETRGDPNLVGSFLETCLKDIAAVCTPNGARGVPNS